MFTELMCHDSSIGQNFAFSTDTLFPFRRDVLYDSSICVIQPNKVIVYVMVKSATSRSPTTSVVCGSQSSELSNSICINFIYSSFSTCTLI